MLWDDFFNSKVNAFQDVLNSKIYIDKTGLLEYTNSVIDTTSKFICNSRPRRFGKSITADMMTAYYSRSLDTEEMFENCASHSRYFSDELGVQIFDQKTELMFTFCTTYGKI